MTQAMRVDGTPESNRAIIDWTRGSRTPATMDRNRDAAQQLSLSTLRGARWVYPGDWVVRISDGVFDLRCSARSALDRLTDALVEDVLSMSDEEVLAEFREDGGDVDQLVARMRACFEAARARVKR